MNNPNMSICKKRKKIPTPILINLLFIEARTMKNDKENRTYRGMEENVPVKVGRIRFANENRLSPSLEAREVKPRPRLAGLIGFKIEIKS